MSADRTEQQSDGELERAQELSLRRTRPPAELPGYETQRFLGAGAYGEVWVALDQNTGRQVAIKFYTHRGGLDWSLLTREVEKLVFLSADRYVVQLLDVGWDHSPPYYVMEYVENGSLDDYIDEHGTLPASQAIEMFRDVAIGLSHAHGKGVLHCDLKPANVLLDQDLRPRLADFGQSRLTSEQTPALGTLFYMAPEQADLEAFPDARWDVYALGALLYCMLTGTPPYRHEKTISQIDAASELSDRLARYRSAIRNAPPPTEHRSVPGVDRALAEIIDRALAVNPKDRFANVQEVLDALQSRQQSYERRPLLMLGLVGPALLLAVMTLFGWQGYARAVGDSDLVVTERVKQGNLFAAEFVAGMVAGEIDRYYRAVEQVASDPAFVELLTSTTAQPELAAMLEQLKSGNALADDLPTLREEFRNFAARQELQCKMEELLVDQRQPNAASWFVMDKHGTHVAAAMDGVDAEDERDKVLGRNFSWRTYFHGGPSDLASTDRTAEPIGQTHLSSVFISRATNTWKVAITTPVRRGNELIGVLALTVEIGNFMQFPGSERFINDAEQFAVLVDVRPGDHRGAILQHPLFVQTIRVSEDGKLPKELQDLRLDLDRVDLYSPHALNAYQDPVGEVPMGKSYQKDWIAAAASVRLARGRQADGGERQVIPTGLIVLVQEDHQAAIEPVLALGNRLVSYGLQALGVVVGVVTLLWYFVVRVLGDPSRRAPPRNGQTEGSSLQRMSTIPAPRRKT